MLAALITGLTLAAAPDVDGGAATPPVVAAPRADGDAASGDVDEQDEQDEQDEHDGGRGNGEQEGDGGHDEHRDDGDGDGEPRALPRPDRHGTRARNDDDASSVFVDGSIGCGIGGALPALGTTAGLGLFYGSMLGGNACGSVAGFVGGVSGALVAIPSVMLLGPCAAGGATCGAALGAATSDKDIGRAVQWSLPGLGAGLVGGGVATAGLLVSSATNPEMRSWAMPVGTTLVVVGTLLASAGGPLSVAGATLMQADDPDDDDSSEKAPKRALRDGGLEARAAPKTPSPPGRPRNDAGAIVDVAMAF